MATFAIRPPATLEYVRSMLEIHEESFHLNLENDRHNIAPVVWSMKSGASNLAALEFVVRRMDRPSRTVVYSSDMLGYL